MSTANALFKKNGPTEETAQTLRDELFFRRATPRSARATNLRRTPTAAPTFTSARKLRKERRQLAGHRARPRVFRHPPLYGPTEAAFNKELEAR